MSGRSRSIIAALPSGILVKIAGAALNFLAVPIALHLLGEKAYASFMAVLGFAGWLALGNLGIGNLSAMTIAGYADDGENIRERFWQMAVSNFLGVIVSAAILAGPFYMFVAYLSAALPEPEQALFYLSAAFCFLAVALAAMCVAFEGRYIGLLQSHYCNMVRLAGSLLALFMLIVMVPRFPNMLSIMIAMTTGPLISSLWFIGQGTGGFQPPQHFRYSLRKNIPFLLQGSSYLAVSLSVMFYSGGSLPLFAAVFGQDQLATSGVMAKIVQLYFGLTSIFVVPLAAALKQAIAANDLAWARKILAASAIAITGASCVIAAVMIMFGSSLIMLWTRAKLPGLQDWIVPLGEIIVVAGWYHFWIYVCFAFEGPRLVALCALCEVAVIMLAYAIFGSLVSPASSLTITASVMMAFSGIILPLRVLRLLQKQPRLIAG